MRPEARSRALKLINEKWWIAAYKHLRHSEQSPDVAHLQAKGGLPDATQNRSSESERCIVRKAIALVVVLFCVAGRLAGDAKALNIRLTGHPINFESTVVSASDPLAKAVVVKVKSNGRLYAFPPGSILSQAATDGALFLVVHGFGSIFVYDSKSVAFRFLSHLDPLNVSSLRAESDRDVMQAIQRGKSTVRGENDACPDCVIPVLVDTR